MPNRRRRRWFEDFFEDFERIQDIIDEMVRDFEEEGIEALRRSKPLVYGVNIRIGPDGKPQITEFGNVARGRIVEEREPLVDVMDEPKQIRVVVELPGVEKEDIKLTTTAKTLSINVTHPERRFAREIELPAKVDEKSARATYRNGILEVILQKIEPTPPPAGKTIPIE